MITLQQFAGICREFGFVPKDSLNTIDLTDRTYACPGHLVARHNMGSTVTMWMRRNNGTIDDPIMEYNVYEGARGQWSTMPNKPEVIDDPDVFREHLSHFTAMLKRVKKQRRRKAIDEL